MWVFGYGSLMWDGWEKELGCQRRVEADLLGYCRVFNKASVRNWGSKLQPGPTLNLQAREHGKCRGIAFEFSGDKQAAVMDVLKDREGGFDLNPLAVKLADGSSVAAVTLIYKGKNIIADKSTEDIVAMIAVASGTSGSCRDYATSVIAQIRALGVDDAAIAELSAQMDKPKA